ncbi:hypothetical protein [Jannaschia sp. LMIT008]|uniref:hypothetical protein n=1 Tax=Jannaschia maritima TaxID=3032585 RepID=UPI0028116E4A|nr:hypothetical protein [Jannaschia sp. LMIT008]
MNENVENLILARLDQMREENRSLRSEIVTGFQQVRDDLDDLETRINGLTIILTNLGGNIYDIDERLRRLEGGVE